MSAIAPSKSTEKPYNDAAPVFHKLPNGSYAASGVFAPTVSYGDYKLSYDKNAGTITIKGTSSAKKDDKKVFDATKGLALLLVTPSSSINLSDGSSVAKDAATNTIDQLYHEDPKALAKALDDYEDFLGKFLPRSKQGNIYKQIDNRVTKLNAIRSYIKKNLVKPPTPPTSGNQSAAGIKKSLRTIYTGKAPAKTQSGSGIKYARGQDEKTRFEVLGGTIAGGNNNPDLRNQYLELADTLYDKKKIKKAEHKKAYQTAGIKV